MFSIEKISELCIAADFKSVSAPMYDSCYTTLQKTNEFDTVIYDPNTNCVIVKNDENLYDFYFIDNERTAEAAINFLREQGVLI